MRLKLVAVGILVSSLCYGQSDITGTWRSVVTNSYRAKATNVASVITVTFVFTTNLVVTVKSRSPEEPDKPVIFDGKYLASDTRYAGTYSVQGNTLAFQCRETSGYDMQIPDLNGTYAFAIDGAVLHMTNTATGRVRSLWRAEATDGPTRASGATSEPAAGEGTSASGD